MIEVVERVLGSPVELELLKTKPGRRTVRARGPRGVAIVKQYSSKRAPVVAGRVFALADGPAEPVVPQVLELDAGHRVVVLTDVPGEPLRHALLAGDVDTCRRAGAALAAWHGHWRDAAPPPLREHTIVDEVAILDERAAGAPASIGRVVRAATTPLATGWRCRTVVHRDLYEEQLLVGEHVGLIDLDDAALGPPELDVGNLLAHGELLALRAGDNLAPVLAAILDGYAGTNGATLDPGLLERCRRLTLLRLACIHADDRLADLGARPAPYAST